jgi:hypothetical protein
MADVPSILDHMYKVVPNSARMVDQAIAEVTMIWNHEFLRPLTSNSIEECGVGMGSEYLIELFPDFRCQDIPADYNPRELAVIVFGASEGYALDARINATRALAERYPQATIIASGGALATKKTEGDLIFDALPEYQDRIVVDPMARDTIGNAIFVAGWHKENEMGRFVGVEFPMSYREFSCGAGHFTMCDFKVLEVGGNEMMDLLIMETKAWVAMKK